VELRSEAKAPFRLIRMFLTLGAGAAAVVSLGITLYALKNILQGELATQSSLTGICGQITGESSRSDLQHDLQYATCVHAMQNLAQQSCKHCFAELHLTFHMQINLCCLMSGGTDAPELNGVLLNVVINGVGIAGTSWLFQLDLKARQRDRSSVEREEALARLQVGTQRPLYHALCFSCCTAALGVWASLLHASAWDLVIPYKSWRLPRCTVSLAAGVCCALHGKHLMMSYMAFDFL